MFDQINPHRLLLFDAIGALVTSLMLGVVLVYFKDWIGMPVQSLYILSGIVLFYFLFSLLSYLKKVAHWRTNLKIIAFANLLYCPITVALMIMNQESLTTLGYTYFIIEILILIGLAKVELGVSQQ